MGIVLLVFSGGLLVAGLWLISSAHDYRRGTGACEKCGYDLTGLLRSTEACPECGALRADFGRVQFPKYIRSRRLFMAGVVCVVLGILAAVIALAA
jgi:hypothetical protein